MNIAGHHLRGDLPGPGFLFLVRGSIIYIQTHTTTIAGTTWPNRQSPVASSSLYSPVSVSMSGFLIHSSSIIEISKKQKEKKETPHSQTSANSLNRCLRGALTPIVTHVWLL